MSKKWIYEGEMRFAKAGDHVINGPKGDVFFFEPDGFIPKMGVFPIVRPIPDDVVMVERKLLTRFRDKFGRSYVPYCGTPGCAAATTASAMLVEIAPILACAEPAKPKDEILSVLTEARDALPRDSEAWKMADRVVALREKELKERGE